MKIKIKPKEILKNWLFWLAVIIIIGLIFRLHSLRFNYFIGNDPFLHYAVLENAINEHGGMLPENYELSLYPNGARINEPYGLYYTVIIPYYLFFGLIPLISIFKGIPVFYGIISIILLYFVINKAFKDKRKALISALILAMNVGNVYRTNADFFRADAFIIPFLLLSIYCFYKVITLKQEKKTKKENFLKEIKPNKQQILHPVIAGISLGVSTFMWNGYFVSFAIIIAGIALSSLAAFYQKNKTALKSITYYTIITFYTALLVEELGVLFGWIHQQWMILIPFAQLMLPALILMTAGLYLTSIKGIDKRKRIILISAIIIIGMIGARINIDLINTMRYKTTLIETGEVIHETISELEAPTEELLWATFNILLYITPWGFLTYFFIIIILFLLKINVFEERKMFFLPWALISTFLLYSAGRYNFLASYAYAAMAGIAIVFISDLLAKIIKKKVLGTNLTLIIILSLFITPYAYYSYINLYQFAPRMNDYWYDALIWLKQNSNQTDPVLTWWDHGGWVQAVSGNPTYVDSVYGQHAERIKRIGEFLLLENNTDRFEDWNPKYLIVSLDMTFFIDAIKSNANKTDVRIVLPQNSWKDQETGYLYYSAGGQNYFEVRPQTVYYIEGEQRYVIKHVAAVTDINNPVTILTTNTTLPVIDGMFYITIDGALFFNKPAYESNYIKLMYLKGIEGLSLIYQNPYVRIYEFD